MYLLEPMCQRKIFIFSLCILMNNKDLFDLIKMGLFAAHVNTEIIPVVTV